MYSIATFCYPVRVKYITTNAHVLYVKCANNWLVIGDQERHLFRRLSFSLIKNFTGIHFNQGGHSVSDVRITILEKMKTSDESYRKERERYLINKFNTYYKGINRMP